VRVQRASVTTIAEPDRISVGCRRLDKVRSKPVVGNGDTPEQFGRLGRVDVAADAVEGRGHRLPERRVECRCLRRGQVQIPLDRPRQRSRRAQDPAPVAGRHLREESGENGGRVVVMLEVVDGQPVGRRIGDRS
jgi:hypothetical protein